MGDMDELNRRVGQLEDWRREIEISRAREDENRKHMDARFDALEKSLRGINEWFSWATRVIVAAVLVAAVTFIVRGGLMG